VADFYNVTIYRKVLHYHSRMNRDFVMIKKATVFLLAIDLSQNLLQQLLLAWVHIIHCSMFSLSAKIICGSHPV